MRTIVSDRHQIAARMEQLPHSRWHNKLRIVIGSVNFSDAFDALSVAYVVPALIQLWHIAPAEIGLLISIGYAGQMIGALLSGWLAERHGRVPLIIANVALFSLMSLVCIFSQNFTTLLTLRFVQGIGLGGAVPTCNTYISEFAPSAWRGRFVLLQQTMFGVGLTAVALVGVFVVPHLGWQWMFAIGALPSLLIMPMIRVLPESPRWLMGCGRTEEADRVLKRIEALVSPHNPLPAVPADTKPIVASQAHFKELFSRGYRQRTVSLWVLWFCAYGITYALTGWLPSIMRTVYHLSVTQSNLYGFVVNGASLSVVVLAAFTIDRIGRKRAFAVGFLLAAAPLIFVVFMPDLGPFGLTAMATLAHAAMSMIPGSLGMYTAENYPNHLRALGNGTASVWQRLSSVVSPYLVGIILPLYGVAGVFGMFAVLAIIGSVTSALFSVETAGKTLEELSPAAPVRP